MQFFRGAGIWSCPDWFHESCTNWKNRSCLVPAWEQCQARQVRTEVPRFLLGSNVKPIRWELRLPASFWGMMSSQIGKNWGWTVPCGEWCQARQLTRFLLWSDVKPDRKNARTEVARFLLGNNVKPDRFWGSPVASWEQCQIFLVLQSGFSVYFYEKWNLNWKLHRYHVTDMCHQCYFGLFGFLFQV